MSEELQLIIPLIVGGIAVPAINLVKGIVGSTDSRVNLGVSLLVSIFLAVFALFITGAFGGGAVTAPRIVGWVSLCFTVATVIYKGVLAVPPAVPPAQPPS